MKPYLYNFDPHKPPFYIVRLGFTDVFIIFHISTQNIDCGYWFEPPRRDYEKYRNFYLNTYTEIFNIFE